MQGYPEDGAVSRPSVLGGGVPPILVPPVALLGMSAGVFALDVLTPRGQPVWLLYLLPISLSMRAPRRWHMWVQGTLAIALLPLGYYWASPGPFDSLSMLNRYLGAITIGVVTLLAWQGRVAWETVARAERRFRSMTELGGDGVMLIDADGNAVYTSPAMSRI
ncbi:MAG: hypothetical protein AB7V27_19900, partial [Candidatus Binatia bacterium]